MTSDTMTRPSVAARARAASLLGLSEDRIEDDLVDFIVETDQDCLLHARAGSGKTTALAIKVAYLTQDMNVDPGKIVLLTFNNAAARSIEARLAEFGVPDGVRVRTFHAFAQRIVRAHFGPSRRAIFDEKSADGQLIAQLLQEVVDDVVNERFYHFCASKMRTRYDKRRDYVEGIGRDALINAANFLRARGYGLQDPYRDAWDELGPIGGNAMKVVLGFERAMKEEGLLDGPGVLQAASWCLERDLERGSPRPSDAHDIDWVFIDEFQDVSRPYMRLVEAVRDTNGLLTLQGVGDDWQAINGFAGADLGFFNDPASCMDDPRHLTLLRNRRSGSAIVDWGNEVMREAGDHGDEAIAAQENGAGEVLTHTLSAGRDLRYLAQRLGALVAEDTASVALIARKWKVGDHDLRRLTKATADFLKDQGHAARVTAQTAHGSKGLEYDQVLLLDDGSFPLMHPSRPILESMIPDEEHLREEACLKHVAGTRARKRLDVLRMG